MATKIDGSVESTNLARSILNFPNPVNEVAARIVAAMVITVSVAFLVSGQGWLLGLLAYGFAARVASGPTLSPMGLLATGVLVPRSGIAPRLVPGPPKRFAQAIGLVFSVTALGLYFAVGSAVPAKAVLAVLAAFASLEAFVGFCAGCFVFNHLMRWGLIPRSICEECLAVPSVS